MPMTTFNACMPNQRKTFKYTDVLLWDKIHGGRKMRRPQLRKEKKNIKFLTAKNTIFLHVLKMMVVEFESWFRG